MPRARCRDVITGISAFLWVATTACGTDSGAPVTEDATPTGASDAAPPSAATTPGRVARDAGDAAPASDAGLGAADAGPSSAAKCFQSLTGPVKGPDYDQFHPVVQGGCAGTHHQTITGVEKVVFLGDSITEGTPPSLSAQFYRTLLGQRLVQKFGPIEIADCAAWGARMDDLLAGKGEIAKCFPTGVEQKRTLILMTNGGNDISTWAKNKLGPEAAAVEADTAAGLFRDAMTWLKDPAHFLKGSYAVFTNAYEYTDSSGDLASCPAAPLSGIKGTWPEGATAVVHFQEQIMKVAVETGTDMVFLLEDFCGHGYKKDDPTLQCYRGPNTERWFDVTCVHPNPLGHAEIAKLFAEVIDG